jgi:hypothetical protein
MSVGASIGVDQMNNIITAFAVRLRDLMRNISNLNLAVNGQAQGLAYLESIGYSAAPDPANPGGVSDAELAQNMIGYLNTVSAIYHGTATQPDTFNFDQQLSEVWGGQVDT